MQEDRKTQQEGMASSTEKPKLEIEISRYKGILDMIADTRKLAKLILVMAVVLILVFAGVTAIVLIVKKFYPYNTVNTNKYGATVIESEKKDVIYWLFNSADLWANSGIEVKAGDVISVQTSGSFHTAIHHLADDAKGNVELRDPWMKPDGGEAGSEKDKARAEYRIAPNLPPNIILMQVVPAEDENRKGNVNEWYKELLMRKDSRDSIVAEGYIAGGGIADIYIIGKERKNIRIQSDGILHFAVNDVALTPGVIKHIWDMRVTDSLELGDAIVNKNEYKKIREEIRTKVGFEYEKRINPHKPTVNKDTSKEEISELAYYYYKKFVDAWFVDNVGSFLIAIEREKRR